MTSLPEALPSADTPTAEDQATVLFPNDQGALPADTRRALVNLLTGPSLDARRQAKLWQVLLRDELVLRARLHELFLELVIDREQGVAFTRQVSEDDLDAPILLRRANLTFVETVLVIFLRSRLTQSAAHGERATVSASEMLESLSVYERADNTDRAKFVKQAQAAIEKAKKLNFLHKLRGPEDRFEISPTLKLLFPAEEIQALTTLYRNLAAAPAGLPDADESEEE